jgi:hypothetical protein
MTDHEKAATFIGWVQEQTYGALGFKYAKWCTLPAPDMSKPENYMWALETLRQRGFTYSLGGDSVALMKLRAERGSKDVRVYTVALWPSIDGSMDLNSEVHGDSSNSIAEAVIKALAALYNTEHPETEAVPKP